MGKPLLMASVPAFMLLSFEIKAEVQRLICDLKTHVKYDDADNWKIYLIELGF